jgi:hypothetical protein
MVLNSRNLLALLVGLLSASEAVGAFGKKIKRVKAGKVYDDHDAVHIVVNKVG